jgi:hypothetical protein
LLEPLSFQGLGKGGNGWSDTITLPGTVLGEVTPVDKGAALVDGTLRLIRFDTTDADGKQFVTDVVLRPTSYALTGLGKADSGGDKTGAHGYCTPGECNNPLRVPAGYSVTSYGKGDYSVTRTGDRPFGSIAITFQAKGTMDPETVPGAREVPMKIKGRQFYWRVYNTEADGKPIIRKEVLMPNFLPRNKAGNEADYIWLRVEAPTQQGINTLAPVAHGIIRDGALAAPLANSPETPQPAAQPSATATPPAAPPSAAIASPSPQPTPAAPIDPAAVTEVITRLISNASKKPPGPVEKDVSAEMLDTIAGFRAMAKDKAPLRPEVAAGFNNFTPEGSLTPLYAEGRAAIFSCKVKLTKEALAEHKDHNNSWTLTENGKPIGEPVDNIGMFFECGGAEFVGPKIKDAHVIAHFCVVKQHGLWKVHYIYFSKDLIEGDRKAVIVKQVADFANGVSSPPAAQAEKQQPKRQVVVRFELPKNAPALTGSIGVSYGDIDGHRKTNSVQIENGKAQFEVPIPNQIDLFPDGLTAGYSFEVRQDISIEQGTGPEQIAVQAIPAGTIHGDVTEADGSPARGVSINAQTTKAPKGADIEFSVTAEPGNEGGLTSQAFTVRGKPGGAGGDVSKFLAAPLPLGSEYAIVVWRAETFVISPTCHIDEKAPVQNVKMVIPEGKTIRRHLVDPQGTAVPGLEFEIEYTTPWGSGFGTGGIVSDADGWLVIPHFNTECPGEYRLRCECRTGYVPMEVALDPRQTEQEIPLTRGKVITGIINDATTGKPIAGMGVYAVYADCAHPKPNRSWNEWFDAEARTDSEGRFRFSNLAEEDFTLHVRSDDFDDPHETVTTRGGQKEPVILNLKPHPKAPAPSPSPTAHTNS